MDEVSREALRILRLFGGKETKRVVASVGTEQEYFLLPKDLYAQQENLHLTGRTLFGAQPPKGQELDDHYFSTIRTRVSSFTDALYDAIDALRHALEAAPKKAVAAAQYNFDKIVPCMNALRSAADMLETLTDKSYWPYPTYSDFLFY